MTLQPWAHSAAQNGLRSLTMVRTKNPRHRHPYDQHPVRNPSGIAEGRAGWESERRLTDAWEAGLPRRGARRLRTTGGAVVDVIHPGVRNPGDGPDFLDAVIGIGAPGAPLRLVRGDVEMHLRAVDWRAHGHDDNPAFASVVLHVVADACGMLEIADAPILEIPGPAHARRRVGRSGSAGGAGGRPPRKARGATGLAALLDAMGDARLEERAAAMEGDIAVVGPEQALYEALLRGLGYTRNMTAFQEVARLLPIAALRGLTEGAPNGEALTARLTGLLFGTAGLLPSQRADAGQGRLTMPGALKSGASGVGGTIKNPFGAPAALMDDHTASAEAEWARRPGMDSLPAGTWQTFRVRPANHPVRRTGVAVELMRRWLTAPELMGLVESIRRAAARAGSPREAVRRLLEALVIPPTGYWASRRDFGVSRRGAPAALLGRGRALDMIATAALPFLLAVADLESDAELERRTREIHAALPRAEGSQAGRVQKILGGADPVSGRRYQGFLSWTSQHSFGAPREPLGPFVQGGTGRNSGGAGPVSERRAPLS